MKMLKLAALAALVGCGAEGASTAAQAAADPVVRIESPLQGDLVAGPTVEVRGSLTGAPDGAHVEVNGISVPAPAGRFVVQVPLDDGAGTITARHGVATDEVTVEVDGLPPALALVSPERGTVADGDSVLLQVAAFDEHDLVRLEIAGEAQDVGAGPEWALTRALAPGLNTFRVLAEDGAGHISVEDVSVLAGPFSAAEDELVDAVVVHIGAEALAATGDLAASAIATLDLTALAAAQNPVVDSSFAAVTVENVTVAPGTRVEVEPGEGRLTLRMIVEELDLSATVNVKTGSNPQLDARMTIERILVEVPLEIAPDAGIFEAALAAPVFDFQAPSVTVKNEAGADVPAGALIEGEVLETVEAILTDLALTKGGAAIEAALQRLTQPFEYTVAGRKVVLQLTAGDAVIGGHGLELRLSGVAFIDGEPVQPLDPGVPRTPTDGAYGPRGPDVALALSDDLVQAVLHALWSHGVMSFVVDEELMAGTKSGVVLVAGFLGSLLELTGSTVDPEDLMTVRLSAPLPPVMLDAPESDAIALGLGDMKMTFETAAGELATGYLNLHLAAGAVTTTDGVLLELQPFFTGFDLAVEDAAAKRRLEGTIEPFVASFMNELSPLFQSLLGAIPLPSFAGIRIVDLTVGDDGTAGAYLVVRGVAAPEL